MIGVRTVLKIISKPIPQDGPEGHIDGNSVHGRYIPKHKYYHKINHNPNKALRPGCKKIFALFPPPKFECNALRGSQA
jgi:hypothetical protein